MTSHPPFETAALLAAEGSVAHGFFGRRGGVSTGIYSSLNAGPGSGDNAKAVAENRYRIAAAMDAGELVSVYQVHGTGVAVVDGAMPGRPEADAMVTKTPAVALAILTADCVPVLLADPKAGVVGAAHAGWKGALAGVTDACVDAMAGLGAHPADILAAIGPAIQQASYEVGPEFRDRFLEAGESERFFVPGSGDRWQFDLTGYVEHRLRRLGLGGIERLDHDTCAMDTVYFSNRRRNHHGEPDYGRNASVIMLRS